MQIVIDIPYQKYKWIVNNPQTYTDEMHEAIRNGTPLPKNHGRLIDADELEELFREVIGEISKKSEMTKDLEHMVRASAMTIEMIADAPTIIEEVKADEDSCESDNI